MTTRCGTCSNPVGITDLLAMGLRLKAQRIEYLATVLSWNHRPTCDGIETKRKMTRRVESFNVGITDLLAMGLRLL